MTKIPQIKDIEDIKGEKIIDIEYTYDGKDTYDMGKYSKDILLVMKTDHHYVIFIDCEYPGDSADYIVMERDFNKL